MTDQECLEQIIKSLKLKESKSIFLHGNTYKISKERNYTLGEGTGYGGCSEFTFNENGNIINYAAWEQ